MCECLRGIFRVTWTPSSNAESDREQEDSHVFSQTRESTVKDRRQSPPSDRPPPASLSTLHHCGSTDEQESPERAVQKEKLHAELKQVLSLKRSHLIESSCQLAQPEMEVTLDDTMPEVEAGSELVEVMVETEAEAGASGYSVTGGGARGIFVKDVLKDSPAAKHLSLQQGDQLLSARVYFDNVKYEDALKILQCAEPYKVSFLLKRTIPGADVTVHPAAPAPDLKGPKAKMPKMSVKNIKPFKVKKKRGGRFGLKRLKENKKGKGEEEDEEEEEEDDEEEQGSSSRVEMKPVDVEFSLPKFKQSRDGHTEAVAVTAAVSVRKKKKIRFPRMKTRSSPVTTAKGVDPGKLAGQADIALADVPEAKVKGKSHRFGITFPKTKKTKSDPALATGSRGSVELKAPDIKLRPPSVEFSMLSGNKDLQAKEKEGTGKFQTPGVEFSLSSGKADVSLPKADGKAEVKAPKIKIQGGAGAGEAGGKVKLPKTDVEKGDTKLRMPKLKLPKVRLSRHSDEIDGEVKVKGEGPEKTGLKMPHVDVKGPGIDVDFGLPGGKGGVKGEVKVPGAEVKYEEEGMDGEVKIGLPKLHVTKPKIGGDVEATESSVKGPKIKMPSMDVTLPKARGSGQIPFPKYDAGGKAGIKMPAIDVSVPDVDLEMDTGVRKADEVEGPSFKGSHTTMPKFDISLPQLGSPNMELGGQEIEGTVHLPTVDFSTPTVKTGDIDMEAYVGGGGKFKMPHFEISPPTFKCPEGEVNVEVPKGKELIKPPHVDVSLPTGAAEGQVVIEGHEDKGGKFHLPSFDVSLPKIKTKEKGVIDLEGPDIESSGFKMSLVDISHSKVKMEGELDIKGSSGKEGKFQMPTFDISLPKMKLPEVDLEGPEGKGGKMTKPSLDIEISLPKGKVEGAIDINQPPAKGGKFKMPSLDASLPKMKATGGEVEIDGPEIKGRTFEMPTLDISFPKAKAKDDVDTDGKDLRFKMPSLSDISLPKMKMPEGEVNMKGPDLKGSKFTMPTVDLNVPQSKAEADINIEGGSEIDSKFNVPSLDISLPKLKLPEGEVHLESPEAKGAKFETPKVTKGKAEADLNIEGSAGKAGKFKLPTLDISFPKMKSKGVEGSEVKGRKFNMPSMDVNLPKMKSPEGEVNPESPDVRGEGKIKMPTMDISLPRGKAEGDIEGPGVKGGKFQMPTIDLTLPRMKTSEGSVSLKGPEVKELEVNQPSMEVSLPGAKIKAGGKGHASKESKFHMPSIDISLPKVKSKGSDINIEAPDIKGGKIKTPTIEFSHPTWKTDDDFIVEGGDRKGGKFKLPAIDLSLPKVKLPDGDAKIQGPEIKGGTFEMPKLDVSHPKGKAKGDIDIEVHSDKGGKFKMPKFDVSLPVVNLPEGGVKIEGPHTTGGGIEVPTVDFSLPTGKAGGDIGIEGHGGKGGKFHMPSLDVSLPKVKSKGGEVNIEGPAVGVDIEGEAGVGGKFKMPKFDVSLPKMKLPEGNINIEGREIKGGSMSVPSIDYSLPRGKAEGDVEIEGHGGKGGKFHMPSLDISLPKLKSKGGDVNIEGPEVKGGKFNMPSIDVNLPKMKSQEVEVNPEGPDVKGGGKIKMPTIDLSLPRGKAESDIQIEGHRGQGGKFKMPSFDISLPKVNLPEGPEMKGGKIQMPSVDFSLPRGKAEGDIGIEGHGGKGGKVHMPSLDISLPKIKSKGGEVNIEGPAVGVDLEGDAGVGGKFKMPKFDVSLPKMKLPEGNINIEGPEIKGGSMSVPSIDYSFPRGKAEGDVEIEGYGGKGGKFHMPSLDISLPKMKSKGGDVNIEGPEVKGGKFNMPSMDVNLPKVKSPEVEVNPEGLDVRGGKIKMPTIDLSLPRGKAEGEIQIEGHGGKGGKFKMPTFDISLPKLNLPEGPEMPSVDFSLPKGKAEADIEIEGHGGKGGKFHMPSLDISLPKMKIPEGEGKVEGPEMKGGTLEMPTFDVSMPKIKSKEGEVKGPEFKGQMEMDTSAKKSSGGLHMPTIDINMPHKFDIGFDTDKEASGGVHLKMPSMPKFGGKVKGDIDPDFNIKGDIQTPKKKGDMNIETNKMKGSSGSIKLPTVKLPTVDISAPKVDLDFGLSKPKMDEGEVELLKVEGGRPSSGASYELPDISLKMPKFSLPKFGGKTKSGDFEIEGQDPKGEISLSLPQVEGGVRAPSVELDGDGKVKIKVKKPKMKMPSFGISKKETDVSISSPNVDVNLKEGTLDISKPDINIDGPEDKSKYKLKFPKFKKSSPKGKLPEGQVDVSMEGGVEGKGGFHIPDVTIKMPKFSMHGTGSAEGDYSRPGGDLEGKAKVRIPSVELKLPAAKSPEMEVLLPKAELDVSDADIQGYEGGLKIPKMPSLDVSAPNMDLDVSLPKVKGEGGQYKMPSITMPDIDLSPPKVRTGEVDGAKIGVEGGKFKMPHINIPDVDISLSKGKSGKVEGPEMEIKGDGGKFKMPKIDISLPRGKPGKLEGPEIEMEGGGGKFRMPHVKMPHVDLSLPSGKYGKIDTSEADVDIEGKGDKFKMPHVKMPNIDISMPTGKSGNIEGPKFEIEGERGRLKMPDMKRQNTDFSLPKFKSGDINIPDMEIEAEDGKCTMPDVDISMPKGKSVKIEGPGIKMEGGGGRFKMPHMKIPNVDISLPKSKSGKIDKPEIDLDIEAEGGKFKMPHMKVPDIDLSLRKGNTGKIEGPDLEFKDEGGKCKMPGINMPNIDISLPKSKSGEINTPDKEIEAGGSKLRMPHVKMPNVDISLPKGKTGEIEGPEMQIVGEGGKFKMPQFKMPNVDINLPKGKTVRTEMPDIDVEGEGEKLRRVKMPSFDVSLPKGNAEFKGPELEMSGDGGKWKVPKVDSSLSKGSHSDIGGSAIEIEGEGGKFKMPNVKLPNMDISTQKGKPGKIEGPDVDRKAESGKIKMPHVTMPNVDIFLPKGKGGNIETPSNVEITMPSLKTGEYHASELEIKGEGGKFKTPQVKMPSVDISLPKGKTGNIHAPDKAASLQGGKFKTPQLSSPTVDVTMPTVRPGEADIRLPSGGINAPPPAVDLDVNGSKPKHGGHIEDQHKGMTLKMPTMDIGHLELDIGMHKGEGKKDRKTIELPDLELNASGSSGGKVKGPKVKGTKFKIGMPKMKNYTEPSVDVKKPGKEKDSDRVGGLFKVKKPKHSKVTPEFPEGEFSGSISPNISLPNVGISVGNKDVELRGPEKIGDEGGVKVEVPTVTLPTISTQGNQGSASGADAKNGFSLSNIEVKPPRIPDIEFDIGASDDDDDKGTTRKVGETQIPTFGVPLPSISSPEGRMNVHGQEILYEGPKMPKVKKAVFVLVDPPSETPLVSTNLAQGGGAMGGMDKGDVQIKIPKIKMKPTFGKLGSKERIDSVSPGSREVEGEEKSKGGHSKMPKVSFSPVKSGLFDVSLKSEGSNTSLNGDSSKDDKTKFSGKIQMPKVELTPSYSTVSGAEEGVELTGKLAKDSGGVGADAKGTKVKSAKVSFPGYSTKMEVAAGVEGGEEVRGAVVSSHARTDMLDRDSSESPSPLIPGFAMGFSSGNAQAWAEEVAKSGEQMTEERETNPWFKLPNFHLKPHLTGFLQITPEGSPQGRRRGEVAEMLEEELTGTFRLQLPTEMGFTSQNVSDEHQVTTTQEGGVTMVTKTTKHIVTMETRTAKSTTTTMTQKRLTED